MAASKKVHYLDLLGLAINGFLRSAKMESCTDPSSKVQKSKIVGITYQGEEFETECIEYHRIVRTWIIIKHYDKWGKYMVSDERVAAADFDVQEDSEEKSG